MQQALYVIALAKPARVAFIRYGGVPLYKKIPIIYIIIIVANGSPIVNHCESIRGAISLIYYWGSFVDKKTSVL